MSLEARRLDPITSSDIAMLRIPNALVSDLIVYCVAQTPTGPASEALIRSVVSALLDLPIREIRCGDETGTGWAYAVFVVAREHATAFADLVPVAKELSSPAPDQATFEVSAVRQCAANPGESP